MNRPQGYGVDPGGKAAGGQLGRFQPNPGSG